MEVIGEFALTTTRDLLAQFGERYRRYREEEGMLRPKWRWGVSDAIRHRRAQSNQRRELP
jgi:hypothetical protein